MFFQPVEYDVATGFIYGFDTASNGGALVGFREWLLPRVGVGNNLAWSELVLYLAFPNAKSPRSQLCHETQKSSVEFLINLLETFWQERQSLNGMRTIYLNYHAWLKGLEWYGPNNPEYVAEDNRQP